MKVKSTRCGSCGGPAEKECIDNSGQRYLGCSSGCIICIPEPLGESLQQQLDRERIRAHEARALLQKLAKCVREDGAVAMVSSSRLAKLSLQVDDYLKRTHDPLSILRKSSTEEP